MAEDGPTLFDPADNEPLGKSPVGDLQTFTGLRALTRIRGIGSTRAIKLAQKFRTSEAFNQASPEERRRVAGAGADGPVTLDDGQPPAESIRQLCYFDSDYPAALRDIKDPPAVLWARGNLKEPARRTAIVGTREGTPWGLSVARAIARAAAEADIIVVSGLALGIDIAAHREAMSAGGQSIAILGTGIDRISPREHHADADEIVATGGCLLTEQQPGTPPSARTLVARNRLQTGMSAATVIVQCGINSGTLKTAGFAMKQGKTLAVCQPPDVERADAENAGNAILINATPRPRVLGSREDLLALLAEI